MAPRLSFSVARASDHLREVDAVVAALIEQHGPYRLRPGTDPYASVVRAILFQQLAGNAARAIQRRWYGFYGDEERTPTPEQILETSDEEFRAAGISRQKAGYLRGLAERVHDGRLDFADLPSMPDDEVAARLIAVKGIGEWTAHMFLMFELGRPDVLPVGDYGVRNGMRLAYGLDELPTPARAREIGAPWTPYRSVGAWYMWRAVETVLPQA